MSSPATEAKRAREQKEYLTRVRALSQALTSAISAIEGNDLLQLQNSIAAQENLCSELTGGGWLPLSLAEKKTSGTPAATALPPEIRAAHLELARLNRAYAALLRRAQHSAALLSTLYRNYGQGQGYHNDSPAPAAKHSLSCEV